MTATAFSWKRTSWRRTDNRADEEIEVPDEPSDGIWETTARIKSYKNVSISPNSITEFAVSGDAGQYITPEIIFGNNDLVIFEQEDGSGWELNEGETLMIQATEYEAETNGGNGQGIMYFISVTVKY